MVSSKQAKGGKEIPTPDVRLVPTYTVEYLPVHKEPRVYIRGKGKKRLSVVFRACLSSALHWSMVRFVVLLSAVNRAFLHKLDVRIGLLCTAGVGWQEDDEVDYDLDEQDRQWLAAFNRGQERLPYRRMELLLWRLDTANAEATDSAFASKVLLDWHYHEGSLFVPAQHITMTDLQLATTNWPASPVL